MATVNDPPSAVWGPYTPATNTITIYGNTTSGTSGITNVVPYQVPSPAPAEAVAEPEDPVAWLRRRVNEILWEPSFA